MNTFICSWSKTYTMALAAQSKLGSLLEATSLFTEDQIEKLLSDYQTEDKAITDLVIDLGYSKDDVFLKALAKNMRVPYIRLNELTIDKEALERLPNPPEGERAGDVGEASVREIEDVTTI